MKKIIILLTFLILSFVTVFIIFGKIERYFYANKLKTISILISNDLDKIQNFTIDWAKWDDTVNFMETHSNNYIESNINEDTLKNLGIDFILYFGRDKNLFYGFFVKSKDNLTENDNLFILKLKTKFYNSLSYDNHFTKLKTFAKINNNIYMLSFAPVTKNSGKPPAYGTLVFGKKFNSDYLAKLSKITLNKITIVKHVENKFTAKDGFIIKGITGYLPIRDYNNKTVCFLIVDFEKISVFSIFKWLIFLIFLIIGILIYCMARMEGFGVEKELKEELSIISSAINQSKTGVILSEFNGTVFYVNNIVCEITGFDRNEIIGKHYGMLLGENILQNNFFKQVIKNKGYWKGELRGKTKDGNLAELEVNITPIFDENNKQWIKCFITTCEFISEKKKYIRFLQQAKEEAEHFNKIRDSFFARISHEFKTPLTGIKGFVELLELTDLDNDQRNYISYLKQSTDRLEKLLNNLIEFTKNNKEIGASETSAFSLKEFAYNSISNNFKAKANEKGLIFKIFVDNGIPDPIVGNREILLKVLSLLIDNSVKFTEKGEIEFSCNLLSRNEKENIVKICFKIRDTGIGMTDEEVKRLFIPFSQADLSAKRKFEGVGIGLSLAKKYVKALNGKIEVDSKKGKGTEFRVILDFKVSP